MVVVPPSLVRSMVCRSLQMQHLRQWTRWQRSRHDLLLTDAKVLLHKSGRRTMFAIIGMVIGRTATMGADGLCR